MTRRMLLWLLMTCTAVGAPVAAGQPDDVKKLPGYVELEDLGLYDGDLASLEISIHEPLIGMVATAVSESESELAKVLRGLKSIRLRTFPVKEGDGERLKKRSAEIGHNLERKGWASIVRVRDEGEDIQVFLRTIDDQIAGMMLLALEDGDSITLVNIVGSFDPEELGQLGRSFNIEPLEVLGEHTGGRHKKKTEVKPREEKP